MPQLRVRDVMTPAVMTAHEDASCAEVAAVLASHQISAVPIVDPFDAVVGVVSWTDLRAGIDVSDSAGVRVDWWRRWAPNLPYRGGTAVQVMSAPALTVVPDASLPAAARVMYRRNVGRLLVVESGGRLLGIVTRSDLLKVHARLDAVIRDDVMQRVLRRTLMISPPAVRATVDDGVVTLTGHTARRSTALAAAQLAGAVAGVTGVVDRLAFDVDDTAAVAHRAEIDDRDPLRAWWIGRQPAAAVEGRIGADRPLDRNGQMAGKSAVSP
jgi:CBS domain-containing protein